MLAFIAVIALLYFGRLFFITLIIGVIGALLLEPLVRLVMKFRIPRSLASALVCCVALGLVYYGAVSAYNQVLGFAEAIPQYSAKIDGLLQQASARASEFETRINVLVPKRSATNNASANAVPAPPPPVQTIRARGRNAAAANPTPAVSGPPPIQEVHIVQEDVPLLLVVWNFLSDRLETLLMVSFVPFLVYFILVWQEHMIRSLSCFFREPIRLAVRKSWKDVAKVARIYTIGNVLLGLVLAALSAISFYLLGLPYAFLTGVISGFVSLVPYVGLPLALLPPLFPAMIVYQDLSPFFLLATLVATFHLLALNLLYPKIVGASLHLNPLAVTVALMFWSTIWGPVGFILGIPVTAGIKAVCDSVEGLQDYGRLLGDNPS